MPDIDFDKLWQDSAAPAKGNIDFDKMWADSEKPSAQPTEGTFLHPVKPEGKGWGAVGKRIMQYPGLIAGKAIDAFKEGPKLMGDVAEGKVDPISREGVERATDVAGTFSPGAPMRAGIKAAGKEFVPTAKQALKGAEREYDALKNSSTVIKQQSAEDVHDSVVKALAGEHWYGDINAPQTTKMLGKLKRGKDLTIGELKGVRESLNKVGGEETDQAAAAYASNLLDHYMANVPASHVLAGDPVKDAATLRRAAQGYRAGMRSNALTDMTAGSGSALERSGRQAGRSGAGWNTGNSMRQRIDALINNKEERARFSQEEIDALAKIVKGTAFQNLLRQGGKAAPTGVVSAAPLLIAALSGQAVPAAAVGLAGFGARAGEEALTRRAINKVAEGIRRTSPLYHPLGKLQISPAKGTYGNVVRPPALGAAASPVIENTLKPERDPLDTNDPLAQRSSPHSSLLDMAKNFASGGVVGALQGAGHNLPRLATAPQKVLNNPSANMALGVMGGGGPESPWLQTLRNRSGAVKEAASPTPPVSSPAPSALAKAAVPARSERAPSSPASSVPPAESAWSPEMAAQYKEWRRGGAAGPPDNRTLWAPQFERRLKEELGGAR